MTLTRRGFFGLVAALVCTKPLVSGGFDAHTSDMNALLKDIYADSLAEWSMTDTSLPGVFAADHVNDGTTRAWMGIPR